MAIKVFPKGSDEKISANFRAREFDCPCSRCTETLIDVDFVQNVLQKIRDDIGEPIYVCGYRCPEHNAEIPNASPVSYHLDGMAFDCSFDGDAIELARAGERLGVNGIGYYKTDNFTHLDSRPSKSFWLGHEQEPTDSFLTCDEKKLNDFIGELKDLIKKYE